MTQWKKANWTKTFRQGISSNNLNLGNLKFGSFRPKTMWKGSKNRVRPLIDGGRGSRSSGHDQKKIDFVKFQKV